VGTHAVFTTQAVPELRAHIQPPPPKPTVAGGSAAAALVGGTAPTPTAAGAAVSTAAGASPALPPPLLRTWSDDPFLGKVRRLMARTTLHQEAFSVSLRCLPPRRCCPPPRTHAHARTRTRTHTHTYTYTHTHTRTRTLQSQQQLTHCSRTYCAFVRTDCPWPLVALAWDLNTSSPSRTSLHTNSYTAGVPTAGRPRLCDWRGSNGRQDRGGCVLGELQ
jgi:hypothetical protein